MAQINVALPPYNEVERQIFCINYASNAAGKCRGTTVNLEAGFKNALDIALPLLTPVKHWTTAWGPAVYKTNQTPRTGPVNAWFVAQNDKDKILVVAIAGTAEYSGKAWLEDCNVATVVDFDEWTRTWTPTNIPTPDKATTKSGSLVSRGTCYFIKNILTYKSPSTGAATGTFLGSFLQEFQTKNPDYKIVFTGHSLGGAVSPALALGLLKSKILKDNKLSTMPTAGASPGNSAFNESFTKSFPKDGSYNVLWYNTLDMVPQAWSSNTSEGRHIDNVNTIYNKASPKIRRQIARFVILGKGLSNRGTQYLGLPGEEFTSGRGVPDGLSRWKAVKVAGSYQHVDAYVIKIKIEAFVEFFKDILEKQKGVDACEELEDDDHDEGPSSADIAAKLGISEEDVEKQCDEMIRAADP